MPAGCWSRPPGTTAPDRTSAAPCTLATPASQPRRSRSPGPLSSACTAPGNGSSSAPNAAPSSSWPPRASWPASAGQSPRPNDRPTPTRRSASVAARHAREHPRQTYEQPATRRPRSLLDGGASRRTTVMRPPGPAHISLTARRAPPAGPPPTPIDHNTTTQGAQRPTTPEHLTNPTPYQTPRGSPCLARLHLLRPEPGTPSY